MTLIKMLKLFSHKDVGIYLRGERVNAIRTMKKQNLNSFDEIDLKESGLKNLFIDELKDIFWVEKHQDKAMPKIAETATSVELRAVMELHLTETQNQINRLKQIFKLIGEKAGGIKCEAMAQLVKEIKTTMEETEAGSLTRDAAIILSAQKIEHYEIASYGTLKTLAITLKLKKVATLLEETLKEEKKTDATLTQIAESFVNEIAKSEK